MAVPAAAEKVFVYVGQITSNSVLLAWGTVGGSGNTIGHDSVPLGAAQVKIDGRELPSEKNWLIVEGLQPDTEYGYEIEVAGKLVGQGKVRTYPETAQKLAFFVMGDYGNGSRAQRRIAEAMQNEFEKHQGTDNPVRFVITTGDNIYGDEYMGLPRSTGKDDRDWEDKFFRPYESLLHFIPFYPSLGNHDGNVSEERDDLATYLDNFFFPGGNPARFYHFNFGGLADFFALDSTWNTLRGPRSPAYYVAGGQFIWMKTTLPACTAPWKFAYFHHPPFSAGPRHEALLTTLDHWVQLFAVTHVNVVFNGHEHNLQFSEQNEKTGGVLYVVSGAGGELRDADVRHRLKAEHIAGWAPQNHFLLVEIEGRTLRITPLGFEKIVVRDPKGKVVPMPLELTLPPAN